MSCTVSPFLLKLTPQRSGRSMRARNRLSANLSKGETVAVLVWLNTNGSRPWSEECRPCLRFYPPGGHCCYALVYPWLESSSSFSAPLSYQAIYHFSFFFCVPRLARFSVRCVRHSLQSAGTSLRVHRTSCGHPPGLGHTWRFRGTSDIHSVYQSLCLLCEQNT